MERGGGRNSILGKFLLRLFLFGIMSPRASQAGNCLTVMAVGKGVEIKVRLSLDVMSKFHIVPSSTTLTLIHHEPQSLAKILYHTDG